MSYGKKGLYEDYKAELLTQEEYLSYRDDYTTKEKAFLHITIIV